MSKPSLQMSRRTVLKGLGAAISLPLLEAMAPARALAAAGAAPVAPNRMAFLYVPNGMHMPEWTPSAEGAKFELPRILQPLKPFQKDLLVMSGLAHDKARANGDGGGDHARSAATFLTATQARKTSGADLRAGISVDQVAAEKIGRRTRFPSLELGCEEGAQAGNCDSGYSCAYSSNISWRSESTPAAKEVNPRLVFERLFGGTGKDAAKNHAQREKYNKSILDFVLEDARQLQGRLGMADQRKMDEYLTSVRELETRIAHAASGKGVAKPDFPVPAGVPKDYAEHIRLMNDLIVLAFQTDMTRVCTFLLSNESSNRSYPMINVNDGHHELSHHGGDKEKQRKISEINLFHVQQFSHLLKRLSEVKEAGGSLLDHSMIVYGSGIADGDRHAHHDLPILVAGRGCGSIKTGRHVRYPKETPVANLFLSMLDFMDADTEKLGDSTGKLPGLDG